MRWSLAAGARSLCPVPDQAEERIDALDPAKRVLVADTSNAFNASMLYIESVLRRNLSDDDKIRLGNCAVMKLVPYLP